MKEKDICIPTLVEEEELKPFYASEGAAGADVRAYITESIVIRPGERKLIPTGIKLRIPEGFEMQVRPRSGLALRYGITLVNSPGTIDSDYRGEIQLILINHSQEPFKLEPYMRIGQLVVSRVYRADFNVSVELEESFRGEEGFGSTGLH